jgi:hypothetical protein
VVSDRNHELFEAADAADASTACSPLPSDALRRGTCRKGLGFFADNRFTWLLLAACPHGLEPAAEKPTTRKGMIGQ